MTSLAIAIIRLYRMALSPLLPNTCRFTPSCSEYAVLALKKYGLLRGLFLAIARVLRCNPFNRGGYDPLI
jgi:putative membrane protein insertion efficiency factor